MYLLALILILDDQPPHNGSSNDLAPFVIVLAGVPALMLLWRLLEALKERQKKTAARAATFLLVLVLSAWFLWTAAGADHPIIVT